MTANAMQGDRAVCLQAGMDDYIAKPVRADDLVVLLQRWADPDVGGAHARAALEVGQMKSLVFDPSVLADTVGDDEDFVREVLAEFAATSPEQLDAIDLALRSGPDDLMKAAHALKGACRSIGALDLAEACAALEAEGRAGRVPSGHEPMERVRHAYEALSAYIDGRLAKAAA